MLNYHFPHIVEINLELVLHVSGQVRAAVFDLVHVLPLAAAGEVKGELVRKQFVNPVQEFSGHCRDAF